MDTTKQPIKIFVTGATGYIGGSVLTRLLEPSQAGKWDITVLTRSESTFSKFKELGVTPLLGTLDDAGLMIKAASEADVVMHLADADHLPGVQALIKGCSSGGKRRIYIHNSGTAELADDSKGDYTSDKVVNDLDLETIHSFPLTQPHRDVDSYIFDNCQGFESIIVCPPTIYGLGTGPFKHLSVQIPMLIKAYIKYGYAATIGKGLNVWNNVHIEDLADFYLLLLEKALSGKASTGREGWYFCESGENYLKDVVAEIGKSLYDYKLIQQAEPVQFKPEEVDKYLGSYGWQGIASNSRCKADRARALGWKPSGTRGTIFDNIKAEVQAVLNQENLLK